MTLMEIVAAVQLMGGTGVIQGLGIASTDEGPEVFVHFDDGDRTGVSCPSLEEARRLLAAWVAELQPFADIVGVATGDVARSIVEGGSDDGI